MPQTRSPTESVSMHQFNIKLRRNEGEQVWSLTIDGTNHDSVDTTLAKERVKRALAEAEAHLDQSTARRTQ
jgi:hypothetical protein